MFLEPSGLLGVTPELLDNLPLFTLNRLSLVGPLPGGYKLEVGALTPPNTSALPVEYSPVSCPPTRCPPASPSDACFFCLPLEDLKMDNTLKQGLCSVVRVISCRQEVS